MLSPLPNNGNQETTHEQTYITETISEPYNIEELTEGTFPLYFKFIYHYQREYPYITKNLNVQNLRRVLFAESGML